MNDPGKVDLLREVADAFNRHDLEAIMAAFSAECVFESPRGPDPWGKRFVGKGGVREGLAAGSPVSLMSTTAMTNTSRVATAASRNGR